MGKVIGGVTTSHIPAIGNALANPETRDDPYWKRFFDGYGPVKEWLDEVQPDVAIVVYNDHGLNFFLNAVPTMAIGCAAQYRNADEGWAIPQLVEFEGTPELSWHIVESLIEDEFDITSCQEMLVDHGFVVPMQMLWGDRADWPVKVIPLAINTVQHPLPTGRRLYKLGQALNRAIESYPEDIKVVVIGTGGLSHQLQGERSGLINVDYDLACMQSVIEDPDWLANQSNGEIIEQAGTEGVEVIMWLAMRGALTPEVNVRHKHYHAPISNTGAGVLVLECT